MLDSFKDADSWAVDLTYSSVHGRLTLEVLQFISNVIVQGYKIPFFELSMSFFERKNTSACKPDIINPLSVSNLRSESKGLFWIFDMSTSLYTSRSLNSKILGIATQLFDRNYCLFKFYLKSATLRFSQTTENFSLSLRILAMGFQNIFSSVCSLSGSLQLHIFLHQFWSHYRNRGGARASLWLFPWW